MVGELALQVQRLVEHRAAFGGRTDELDRVTEPVAPLVDLIVGEVQALAGIDADLRTLDEGAIVRALAASEARGEPRVRRQDLLLGLDRLRALEDARGRPPVAGCWRPPACWSGRSAWRWRRGMPRRSTCEGAAGTGIARLSVLRASRS